MPLRRLLFSVFCLLPSLAFAATGSLTITRVYTGWRDAASFKRISEYFTGQENTHGETIQRTHPEQRGGYYFLVRVADPGPVRTIKASLHVVTATNSRPVDYLFPVQLKDGDTVFNIGLTGPDWTDPKSNPVAWKLELTDNDGHVLATETSYLWEKPATN